jgi:hypothetical protein
LLVDKKNTSVSKLVYNRLKMKNMIVLNEITFPYFELSPMKCKTTFSIRF